MHYQLFEISPTAIEPTLQLIRDGYFPEKNQPATAEDREFKSYIGQLLLSQTLSSSTFSSTGTPAPWREGIGKQCVAMKLLDDQTISEITRSRVLKFIDYLDTLVQICHVPPESIIYSLMALTNVIVKQDINPLAVNQLVKNKTPFR